jgi:hypothetical protein
VSYLLSCEKNLPSSTLGIPCGVAKVRLGPHSLLFILTLCRTQNGDTVLHLAARGGHTELLDLLLNALSAYGADELQSQQWLLDHQNQVHSPSSPLVF